MTLRVWDWRSMSAQYFRDLTCTGIMEMLAAYSEHPRFQEWKVDYDDREFTVILSDEEGG